MRVSHLVFSVFLLQPDVQKTPEGGIRVPRKTALNVLLAGQMVLQMQRWTAHPQVLKRLEWTLLYPGSFFLFSNRFRLLKACFYVTSVAWIALHQSRSPYLSYQTLTQEYREVSDLLERIKASPGEETFLLMPGLF